MTPDQIAKANAGLRHQSALDRMAMGNGERTRPACCRRRRAVGFVTLIFPQGLGHKICWTRFAARRRKPHAGGVCSPILTAWIPFNVPRGVARELSGPLPVCTLKRRERRAPFAPGAGHPISQVSLAPGFSRVVCAANEGNGFNRFPRATPGLCAA